MSSRSVLFSSLFVGVALVACGGAESSPPRSPDTSSPKVGPSTAEPTTVEEAQSQIANAKAQLAGASPADKQRFAEPPGQQPAPSPPTSTTPRTKPAEAKTESSVDADQCLTPCRAITSMRRAVGALCRMTGDDDTRCADAKKTLAESEAKMTTCAC